MGYIKKDPRGKKKMKEGKKKIKKKIKRAKRIPYNFKAILITRVQIIAILLLCYYILVAEFSHKLLYDYCDIVIRRALASFEVTENFDEG